MATTDFRIAAAQVASVRGEPSESETRPSEIPQIAVVMAGIEAA